MSLYIPTFIANENFTPAKVNPRMFFYNGLKPNTPGFKFGGWTDAGGTTSNYQDYTSFPYFDHYQGDIDPTTASESLLFFNEPTAYGQIPADTLYTKYWQKYISLLYNPKTRFVECEAQIPFAVYVKLELNDVIIFKSNHYHLRAVNDYNLKTGDCKLQLLGPIISDTLT